VIPKKGPPIFKAWLVFSLIAGITIVVFYAVADTFLGFILTLTQRTDLEKSLFGNGSAIIQACGGALISFMVFRWVINRWIAPNVWSEQGHAPTIPPQISN
jgi:hypothetical protein